LTLRSILYYVGQMKEIVPVGQFEQLVLTAILTLGDKAYGVTIHAKIEELAKPRSVALGAVYATLDRLEEKKLIASWLSEPTKARGGRSRRHYHLQKSGEDALAESAESAKRIYQAVEQNWRGFKWKPSR
jgi:PadR family transcriptional regulator, regulatory protein PadR